MSDFSGEPLVCLDKSGNFRTHMSGSEFEVAPAASGKVVQKKKRVP